MSVLKQVRSGVIPEVVKAAAAAENVGAQALADEIAAGRAVIPANTLHSKGQLRPIAIGRLVTTKINANIGASSEKSSLERWPTTISWAANFLLTVPGGKRLVSP